MRRIFFLIALQLALGLGFYIAMSLQPRGAVGGQINEGWDDWDVIPGRVIIKYKPTKSAAIKAQGLAITAVPWRSLVPIEQDVEREIKAQSPTTAFKSLMPDTFIGEFDPALRDEVIKALAADPEVVYFEPDRIRVHQETWGTSTPNDPLRNQLWGMDRIGAPLAWRRQSATRSAIRVAVMEDRYNDQHRDLTAQHVLGNNAGPISNHATHVSGTIAATGNNNLDVVGVANISLVSLGFPATQADMATQITWAVNNQVRVINMSWKWCRSLAECPLCRYPAPSQTEQDAISNALGNIVFVAAAGNDSCRTDDLGRFPIPVSYTGVIGVSALNQTDGLAGFSNFGPYVALTAPGVNILSTIPGNNCSAVTGTGCTGTMQGTSMAAPHVAGAAAAILALSPIFDVRSLPALLARSAEHLGAPGRNEQFGDGVVRVDRAASGLADVFAESGAPCGIGTLANPFCTLGFAVVNVPIGGTIGLVRGVFSEPITITRPLTIISIGGDVTIQ